VVFKRFYLSVLLVLFPWQVRSATTTEDAYYSGNIDRYPKPVPVSTVKRTAKIEHDAMSMAFRQFSEALDGMANSSVRVRISAVGPASGTRVGQKALYPLKVSSVWKNIHPKQQVDSKALEGKPDRTMGAGGLFSGSAKGSKHSGGKVDMDVPYKIPKWGDHLFLLADGIAYPVDSASASIAQGTDPDKSFTLARLGQEVEVHSQFTIPRTAKNIALHIFDYNNGNIQIPLSGDIALARGSGYPQGVTSKAKIGELDLGVASVATEQKSAGIEADKGWTYLTVDLVGKSNYRKGKKASIARIDAEKYIWLEGDGGFIFPSLWVKNGSDTVRFTPEFFSSERIGFLVPDQQKNFHLVIRDGSKIARLPIMGGKLAAPPLAFASFKDGDVAEWQILSLSKSDGGLLVDMGIRGLDAQRGLEVDPFRQVSLADGISPDHKLSQALALGVASKLIVPPGGYVRFVLAFKGDEMPASLHIQGMRGEGELALKGVPEGDLKLLSLARPEQPEQAAAMRKRHESPEKTVAAAVRKDKGVFSEKQSQALSAPVETFQLPVWDLTGALVEKEQGDGIEHAIELSKTLVAKGSIGGKDDRDDFYFLDIQGKPQLWTIEAAGASIDYLAYVDASQHRQLRKGIDKKTGEVRLLNLLLGPGRHWVEVSSSRKRSGDYQLRAIAMGEPSTDSEIEPNNDTSHSNRLKVGQSVSGLVDDGDDDRFRFSLKASEHLQVRLQTSDKLQGRFSIKSDISVAESKAKKAGETLAYTGSFPPGDYEVQVRSAGRQPLPASYRLSIARLDPFTRPQTKPPALPLSFSETKGDQRVAAFWPQAQRIQREVRITNNGAARLSLSLQAWSSHDGWKVEPGMKQLSLEPRQGQAVPITVLVEPDVAAEHVVVALAAFDQLGGMKSHQFGMSAVCGDPPVNPETYFDPPGSLLGGLDVAWSGLGARVIAEKWQNQQKVGELVDGVTPGRGGFNVSGFQKEKPDMFTVKLAGDAPVSVKGIALNPMGACASKDWINDFEVAFSSDGVHFEKGLRGNLKRLPKEQYFVLQESRKVTHARLHVLSTHSERDSRVCLGEWKVIADPSASIYPKGLNIADPGLGGHLVWHSIGVSDQLLSGTSRRSSTKMFSDRPNEWVVGFRDDRMARIAALEWEHGGDKGRKRLSQVRLAASRNGPIGPWESMGEWQINAKEKVSRFSLKAPVWARFIRFSAEVEKTDSYDLPSQLRIVEQPAGGSYRSVVGEWGNYSPSGPYEWNSQGSKTAKAIQKDQQNSARERAIRLEYDKSYQGSASLGRQAAWYRLDIPKGSNRLEWELTGYPSLTVRPLLMTRDGKRIPIHVERNSGQRARYAADVEGERSYLLQIEEPPRSIVFTWDNSSSVAPYLPSVYQMLNTFATQVQPSREYVNLLPFQDGAPNMLMEQWSDQPFRIMQALNDYPRNDGSSNAELNLQKSIEALEELDGNRAVIIITDAESGKKSGEAKLWEPMGRVYPRIFALELHGGKPFNQDKMQDWSFVNSGHYSYFRNQTDIDTAFERTVCQLRRPANFSLVANTNYQKPAGPGWIQVSLTKGSDQTAVEIILDASGSMYKKLGGETRIAIAKSVLKELMQNSIPKGTHLALRIYGHRKAKACDTKLEMPLGPFDPEKGISLIGKIDPKDRSRTPLAESLALVANDIKSATGKSVVILLTDGEESCGGDPDDAIRTLREQGIEVQINIVGLAIDSVRANKQFSNWAKLGGGTYFEAKDRDGLKSALNKALFPKFQLLNRDGEVVAEGIADGSPYTAPSGRYQLKVLTTPARMISDVVISEDATKKVEVKN
jgi:hypothetical protein